MPFPGRLLFHALVIPENILLKKAVLVIDWTQKSKYKKKQTVLFHEIIEVESTMTRKLPWLHSGA